MDGWVLASVFATATVSGVFGMAGGVILLLILTFRLPLAQAMVLHGGAQLVSNGSRALISREHLATKVLLPYLAGALTAFGLALLARVRVDSATALILTGVMPFLEPLLFRLGMPSVDRRSGAIVCGALVTLLHLTAGATGPLLDVFFLRTQLSRHQVVATKATTQCLGHLLKMIYFGELTGVPGDAALWLLLIPASVLGTWCGRQLLDRLEDAQFRSLTRRVVLGVGGASLARGLYLLASGQRG